MGCYPQMNGLPSKSPFNPSQICCLSKTWRETRLVTRKCKVNHVDFRLKQIAGLGFLCNISQTKKVIIGYYRKQWCFSPAFSGGSSRFSPQPFLSHWMAALLFTPWLHQILGENSQTVEESPFIWTPIIQQSNFHYAKHWRIIDSGL